MLNSVKMKKTIKIFLANPRGFCAGVKRAVNIVETALNLYGIPIYVHHDIIHNKIVVNKLRDKGIIFVENMDEVPDKAIVIFSAHGVSQAVEKKSLDKKHHIIDATCPLVKKVHLQAKKLESQGYNIILIGSKYHPEVIGTCGRIKQKVSVIEKKSDIKHILCDNSKKYAYVTQTTLNVEKTNTIIRELKKHIPNIVNSNTDSICYATQNRQKAVKLMSDIVDTVIVTGDVASSNTNNLYDIAIKCGVRSYLVSDRLDMSQKMLHKCNALGLISSASAPEELINEVITYIQQFYDTKVIEMQGVNEDISFKMPVI